MSKCPIRIGGEKSHGQKITDRGRFTSGATNDGTECANRDFPLGFACCLRRWMGADVSIFRRSEEHQVRSLEGRALQAELRRGDWRDGRRPRQGRARHWAESMDDSI